MSDHHHTQISRSLQPPFTFMAYCQDCGWSSPSYSVKLEAQNDADGHIIAMAGH